MVCIWCFFCQSSWGKQTDVWAYGGGCGCETYIYINVPFHWGVLRCAFSFIWMSIFQYHLPLCNLKTLMLLRHRMLQFDIIFKVEYCNPSKSWSIFDLCPWRIGSYLTISKGQQIMVGKEKENWAPFRFWMLKITQMVIPSCHVSL